MNWYLEVLSKYAVFSGRARRMEYWMFVLFNFIAFVILGVLDALIGTAGVLGGLYALAVLVPSLAVGVRRLHDTERTGWWLLIGLVPVVGVIVLLIFMLLEGTSGDNQYGVDPKALAAAAA